MRARFFFRQIKNDGMARFWTVKAQLLDRMLELFKEKKLLKAKGKQRTDSPPVLAAVRVLNCLKMVVETIFARLAHRIRQQYHFSFQI